MVLPLHVLFFASQSNPCVKFHVLALLSIFSRVARSWLCELPGRRADLHLPCSIAAVCLIIGNEAAPVKGRIGRNAYTMKMYCIWMLLLRVIAAHLITYIPTYSDICLKIILYLSDRCSVLLSNKFSDISPHINYSDMLFDSLFHILQVSGNPSGILSDILSDNLTDILSDILIDILSYSIWRMFWSFTWHSVSRPVWHFVWHSVRFSPRELASWRGSQTAWLRQAPESLVALRSGEPHQAGELKIEWHSRRGWRGSYEGSREGVRE